jgi:hypothetical protein
MKIDILNTAEDDLVDGYLFYEDQEAGIGEYFLSTLFAEIASLHLYAGSHKIVWGRHRMLSKTFPFGIFYTVGNDTVKVWAILDLRRDPSYLHKRATR